jgi:hypothetical protein
MQVNIFFKGSFERDRDAGIDDQDTIAMITEYLNAKTIFAEVHAVFFN